VATIWRLSSDGAEIITNGILPIYIYVLVNLEIKDAPRFAGKPLANID